MPAGGTGEEDGEEDMRTMYFRVEILVLLSLVPVRWLTIHAGAMARW